MSTNNKKSTLTQALLEMEEITSAIKEESKKSLNALLSEAVRDAIREGCNEEDEEDEYEVVDNEKNDAIDAEDETDATDSVEDAEKVEDSDNVQDVDASSDVDATQEVPEDGEGEEDWNEFEKYQVGDNTYDLTGENDYESVVKVYKLLKDEDHVIVKKDGSKIQLKDDSVGTEYVIDLGTDENDGDSVEVENGEENFDSLNEEILGPDDPDFWPKFLPRKDRDEWDSEEVISFNPDTIDSGEGDEEDNIAGFEAEPSNSEISRASKGIEFNPEDLKLDNLLNNEYGDELYESKRINKFNKKARKPMKESKEVLFEVDLGYTDNYQAKDPIAGLSNNEPSKKGKSWHKGVPTGTAKPWAGETKSKGEPFEKTVNEEEMPDMGMEEPVEEATNVGGAVQQRTSSKSHVPAGRKEYGPKIKRHVSSAADYQETVAENKKLKAENKALKETLIALKGNLSEAYVTNVNLGKITKLFLENTTTQAEKVDIVNRFSNEAKTVEQSKALYESIKRELNKPATTQVTVNESMSKANATVINENVYKSKDLLKSIDLMNRMGC